MPFRAQLRCRRAVTESIKTPSHTSRPKFLRQFVHRRIRRPSPVPIASASRGCRITPGRKECRRNTTRTRAPPHKQTVPLVHARSSLVRKVSLHADSGELMESRHSQQKNLAKHEPRAELRETTQSCASSAEKHNATSSARFHREVVIC